MARMRVVVFLAVMWGVGGAQAPWVAPYGEADCAGGLVPAFHTRGRVPAIGSVGFELVVENLVGGAPGLFLLGDAAASVPFLGMIVQVGPWVVFGVGCNAGGPVGVPGAGEARLALPIPAEASLVGGLLFVQGFFYDPVRAPALVYTHGLRLTVKSGAGASVVWDRLSYQALFGGVSAVQADQIGRRIWADFQIGGFAYLRTEEFSCGGERHWMVIVEHLSTKMEFCLIPGGSYSMGDRYRKGYARELPVHRVRVAPFLLARTELTQSVWQAEMGANPSYFSGQNAPVESVSWHEAATFCARIGLRLPSEAEWEYACRAGVGWCYGFGETYPPRDLGPYGWFSDNSGGRTRAVGTKLPNAFGLFDMHGNVQEWCEDSWHADYDCAPADGGAWSGASSSRVVRGGSYRGSAFECRSPWRWLKGSGVKDSDLGFRPAKSWP